MRRYQKTTRLNALPGPFIVKAWFVNAHNIRFRTLSCDSPAVMKASTTPAVWFFAIFTRQLFPTPSSPVTAS